MKHFIQIQSLIIFIFIFSSCKEVVDEGEQGRDNFTEAIIIVRDTSSEAINDFEIKFSHMWDVIPKHKGTTLMGLSPMTKNVDDFRENISIQVFNLEKNYSSKEVINYLIEQSIKSLSEYEGIDEGSWSSKMGIEFYTIEYKLSHKDIIAQSKLFCSVKNKRAYLLVCTDKPDTFKENMKKEFVPIIETFSLK